MRQTFKLVGTIDQNTRVFGTTYGSFSLLVAAAFKEQFDDIKAHGNRPGESGKRATGKTLLAPERDVLTSHAASDEGGKSSGR